MQQFEHLWQMEIVSNNIIGKQKKKQQPTQPQLFDIKKHRANAFFQREIDKIKKIYIPLKNS